MVVPGRVPLCLRCKRTGHIHKDCCAPRCEECRRYGHLKEDCVKMYAVAVTAANKDAEDEMIMDEAEADMAATEAVAGAVDNVTESIPTEVPPEADVTVEGPTEASTVIEEPVPVIEEPAPVAPVAEQPKPIEPSGRKAGTLREGKREKLAGTRHLGRIFRTRSWIGK